MYACVCRVADEQASPCDVSGSTDSTAVTVIDGGGSVVDDVQSVFSVDQDGFFTSMHAECGLSAAAHPTTNAPYAAESDSSRTSASVEMKRSPADSSNQDSVSITALSVQLSSSSLTPSFNDSRLDGYQKTGDEHLSLCAEKELRCFQSPLSVQSVLGAIPSFCSVTPPSSEEDSEATGVASSDWSEDTICNNALSPSATVSTPLSPRVTISQYGQSPDASVLDYYTLPKLAKNQSGEAGEDGKFSTWPCSPVPGDGLSIRGILKSKSDDTECRPPQKCIRFSPVVCAVRQEAAHNCKPFTIGSDSDTEVKASSAGSSISSTLDQIQKCSVDASVSIPLSESALRDQSDDGTLLTERTLCGEAATVSAAAVETSAASDLCAQNSGGIPAALVITSPLVLQSTYVENTHRRLVCRAVRPDEWRKFCSYAGRYQVSSTLPRNLGATCRALDECRRERQQQQLRRVNTEKLQRGNSNQLAECTVCVSQQHYTSVPLAMLRSPRRYGVSGCCGEESSPNLNCPTVDHAGKPTVGNNQKVAANNAVVMKPDWAAPPKNVSETRAAESQRMQHASSSGQRLKPPGNVQLEFRGKQPQQKPGVKLTSEDVCEHDSVAVAANEDIRSLSQSSSCRQNGVIQLNAAGCRAADGGCAAVELDNTDNARARISVTSDVDDSDGVETSNVRCFQSDLLRINSAAVYRGWNACSDNLARSSDSISSTLSAVERSRAAKFAFLGLNVGEDDQPIVVDAAAVSRGCRIFPTRSDDSSASSGLGSSVSGSPVVSPDDNAVVNVDRTSAESKPASLGGLIANSENLPDCTLSTRIACRDNLRVPLTDRSKHTPV